jgi:putative peptidoglycan lipid II flippase
MPVDTTPAALPTTRAAPSAERSFGLVAGGIMVSRMFGFVRNWAFARYFGQTEAADAFSTALRIPNVVRNLLGEGAISASFIPVYSGILGRGDEKAGRALAGALLGVLLAAVSLLSLIGIVLAPVLTSLFAGGFSPEKAELTTRLMRVLFPMTGLMVLSGWCLGIQNSHRRFFASYASAAVWSIAQIVLLFGWGSRSGDAAAQALFGWGPRIADLPELAWWLAWATLAGSVLQIAVQLPEVLSLVRPLRITLDLDAPGLRQTLRNFIPVVISLGVVQVSSLVDLRIASHLPDGAVAALYYGALIYMLPGSVFAVSVAASSLPDFARDSAAATDALVARLRAGWMRILFYILPTTALFIAYGDLVASLLLRSGRFGIDETRVVHWIVAGFSIGLVGFSSVRLLASAFHALQDYRTPLRSSLAAITTSAILALSLALPFRDSLYATAGIAVGSALGSYVNLALLARGLRRKIGPLFTAAMWAGALRIGAVALVATAAAYPVRFLLRDAHYVVTAAGTLAAFGGIFLVAAYATGSQEAERWLRSLRVVRRPTP